MPYEFKDVHDSHCCKVHGCKYGDDANCTVVAGPNEGIQCEDCLSWESSGTDIPHFSVILSIVDHAWKGNKETAAKYIMFLSEQLKRDGATSQSQLLIDFLDILEGRKQVPAVYPCEGE